MVNNLLLHTFYLISHYDSVFLTFIQFQFIKHDTSFRLFYRIDHITSFSKVINSINSVINILPVDSEFSPQCCLMHFGMWRSCRYTTQINTFNTKSIRSTEHRTYIVQTTNIIQHYHQRQFLSLFKLFGTDTVQLCYFQFAHTSFLLLHSDCKGNSFLLTQMLITV